MPSTTISSTNINYTDTGGDGRPVVLLHAFPLNSGQWEQQTDALSDRYRFIVPDLKGFGGSDAPEDASAYSMDDYADSIAGLLDELGLAKVTLVGLSMGGYIAFAFLRRNRDRVDALVLADTRAEADPPEVKEKRSKQQVMVRGEGTAGLIEALTGALIAEATLSGKPDVVDRLRKLMDNAPAGFVGGLEAMKNRPDSSGELAAIDVPTLVIVGEKDGVTPPEAARALNEGISGSRLVVIPGVGHLSNLEDPQAFTGALEEFLAGL
jgi:pimeloyl-ACP methyl ester carboxylesterase